MTPLPIEKITRDSRPGDSLVCRSLNGEAYRWDSLWKDVKQLRQSSAIREARDVVLFTDHRYRFLTAFLALVAEGKTIVLPGSIGLDFSGPKSHDNPLLLGNKTIPSFVDIASLLTGPSETTDTSPVQSRESGASDAAVILSTSGSSGEPQQITKSLRQINTEIHTLSKLWGSRIADTTVCSAVSHQHIYGLLFGVLLPFSLGVPFLSEKVDYPELLGALSGRRLSFVSSPAFLKRLSPGSPFQSGKPDIAIAFSSGGALMPGIASVAEQRLGTEIWEIYGSTETGGVAYRRSRLSENWTPFEGIRILLSPEGQISIHSPYLSDEKPFLTADMAEALPNGSFQLIGRADSIVKLEEKRISLAAISREIEKSNLIQETKILLRQGGRQYLAAVVILSDDGMQVLQDSGRRTLVDLLRRIVHEKFDPVFVPRKWRFIRQFPYDSQSKIRIADLHALFEPKHPAWNYRILYLNTRDRSLECRLSFSGEEPWFQGHFPDYPVLPALAQVHAVNQIARQHLGLNEEYKEIPRMKFNIPISPEQQIDLTIMISPDSAEMRFSFTLADNAKPVSSGRLRRGEGLI